MVMRMPETKHELSLSMPSNVSGAVEKLCNSCTQACSTIKDHRRRRQGVWGQNWKELQKSAITG